MTTKRLTRRSKIMRAISKVVRAVAGTGADDGGVGQRVMERVGESFLRDVQADFAVKSNGGTGLVGGQWPKQSDKYLAYGRPPEGREKTRIRKGAGLTGQNRYRGLLDANQNRRWKAIYMSMLRRLRLSMGESQASQMAARIAWARLKREGAQTKLQVYGKRTVPILKDSGGLYDSFTPGDPENVFVAEAGKGEFGSSHPHAAAHNFGTKTLPRRQILPDNDDEIPDEWADHMAAAALDEIRDEIGRLVGV